MKTQILIPSSGVIDLYDDIPVSLTYNIADIRTPEKRNADYSKTIKVPGTDNNNQILAHIFEIGIDRLFNPNHKTNAEIVVDKVSIMKGVLRLARINTLQDKKIEYDLEFTGRLDDLFKSVGSNLLTDITWTDLDHVFSKANIVNSWSATAGVGYVYPFSDYGFGLPFDVMEVKCFRPATYAKEIWDRIFAYAGFQYSSSFLTSDFFKHLIIPFVSDKFTRSQSQIENNVFYANRNSNQTFSLTAFGTDFTAVNSVAFPIQYNNDSVAPATDAGNVYDTSTFIFTCVEPGTYTFVTNTDVHLEHNATGTLLYGVAVYILRNNVQVGSQGVNYFVLPNTATEPATIPVTWTGVLQAGDTVRVLGRSFVSNFPSGAAFPTVQSTHIRTGSFIYNSLDPVLVANSSITFANTLLQNVKMMDFLLAIIKLFNLYFEYDKDVPNKIYIEPRNDYYNSTIQDWTYKQDVSKEVVIEPMAALDAKRYIYKYKQDKDWLNEKYQNNYQEIKDESYGVKIKTVDNDFLINDNILESLFSPTPQYSDGSSDRVFPKIVKIDPNSGEQSLISANPRILYYQGLLTCQPWTFYSITPTSGTIHLTYPHCGHLDNETTPTLDLSWGVPKEIYYIPPFNATYTNNNLYNRFYRQFIEEITDKDSSIVTGWFHLTPADIALVDFRHIYRFGQNNPQNYRLNKIYDYDPVHDGLTKVEFIKTKQAVPFVYENIPAKGNQVKFEGIEPGPSLPPALGNNGNVGEAPGKVVVRGPDNFIAPTAGNGLIVGAKNIIGDRTDGIVMLNSSGNTVLGGLQNVTFINTSGVTATESNVLYFFGEKWQPCPFAYTVPQMQALAAADLLSACADYKILNTIGTSGTIHIHGASTYSLEPKGFYTSGVITHEVAYDLANDRLMQIYEKNHNNRFTISEDNIGDVITNFPFNNGNYNCNVGEDVYFSVTDETKASVTRNQFNHASNILLNTSGVTSINIQIADCNFGQFAAIFLEGNSAALIQCNIGQEASINFTNGASLTKCDIGTAVALTLDGLSFSGKRLYKYFSNFDVSRDITAIASSAYSFISGSQNQSFAGKITLSTSDAGENITSFTDRDTNFEHEYTFYGQDAKVIRFIHDGVNIICVGAATITLSTARDFATFRFVGQVAIEVERKNY